MAEEHHPGPVDPDRIAALLGPGYAGFDAEARAVHAQLLARVRAQDDVAMAVRPGDDGTCTITFCTWDRVGVLSILAGLLTAHRLDIRDGQVFTVRLGGPPRVLDVLRVSEPARPEDTWDAMESELREMVALLVQRGLDAARELVLDRVSAVARALALTDDHLLPVTVDLDNDTSPDHSLLRIHAPDTAGFLFEFANALAVLEINIERVEVRTVGSEVRDTFWVTDRQGGKVVQPHGIHELKYAAALIKQFTHLLTHAPDPALALRQFGKLTRRMLDRPDWVSQVHSLESEPVLETAVELLGASEYLWEDFLRLQHENLFPVLCDVPGLEQDKSAARLSEELSRDLGTSSSEEDRALRLNSFKDREMFRIDLRHITARVGLDAFSSELSDLADVVVTEAAHMAYAARAERHGHPLDNAGAPCPWSVLALGKAGGRELGFASDVELLFAYGSEGRTDGGQRPVTTAEFFEGLVRHFTRTLKTRREGTFELDLRLRPHGKSGPLASSEEAFARYFSPGGEAQQLHRMALVRMRPVMGDEALSARLNEARDAFVYAWAPLDRAEIAGLRQRQEEELVPAGGIDVKYSAGGLVDLEYFVQRRQIEAGSRDRSVRVTGTLAAIQRLREGGHLEPELADQLRDSYTFLRRLIAALRVVQGHARDRVLPRADTRRFAHLARRLGLDSAVSLVEEIDSRMEFAASLRA